MISKARDLQALCNNMYEYNNFKHDKTICHKYTYL